MRQRDGLKGAIYRAIIGCNTYQGRGGGGENLNFAGMVEAVGGGVGAGGGVGGVPWLQPYELATLQCCKYSDNQRVSLHLFCCGLIMCL